MAKGHDFYLGIMHLPILKSAQVIVCKEGATPCETKAAAESIQKEAIANLNHPKVAIEEESQW